MSANISSQAFVVSVAIGLLCRFMQQLNFPDFQFTVRQEGQRKLIYDIIRKKYVALTPEEWVRQHMLHFMVSDLAYPSGLIAVERLLKVNDLSRRTDIVAYTSSGLPALIVECKSPDVEISQDVFDQVARYNMPLQLSYVVVTNGLKHYTCKIDHVEKTYTFLDRIPGYREL
jgi:hypothetical protein